MKEVDIAATIIQEVETYHFQLRDGAKQKGAIGLTGLFGGKMNPGEKPRDAAFREVAVEEARITPPPKPEQFVPIDKFSYYETERWLKLFKRQTKYNVNVLQLILPHDPRTRVEAKEGTLITLNGEKEVKLSRDSLSPVARRSMERHFGWR
jgi:8-oxo-dGTP pyrophosphatase MutT (NUDIX family)